MSKIWFPGEDKRQLFARVFTARCSARCGPASWLALQLGPKSTGTCSSGTLKRKETRRNAILASLIETRSAKSPSTLPALLDIHAARLGCLLRRSCGGFGTDRARFRAGHSITLVQRDFTGDAALDWGYAGLRFSDRGALRFRVSGKYQGEPRQDAVEGRRTKGRARHQAGARAHPVEPTRGGQHRRNEAGDGLAAAKGAGGPGGHGEKEARFFAHVSEAQRWRSPLPHRNAARALTWTNRRSTSQRSSRDSRR